VFTPFHKPPYPYLYGRSVDETTTQIFLGFRILKQEHKEIANKSKYFWIFSNIKPKIGSKANQSLKTKEANKEKQRKYFWSFYVLEGRNKNKNNKEKKAKLGYTKYRQNMIYR
jgi:hypothetical protein